MQKFRLKYGRREGAPEKENRKEWEAVLKHVKKDLIMPRNRYQAIFDRDMRRKELEAERAEKLAAENTPDRRYDEEKKKAGDEEVEEKDPNASSESTEYEESEYPELNDIDSLFKVEGSALSRLSTKDKEKEEEKKAKEEKQRKKAQLRRDDEEEDPDRKPPGYTWVDPNWDINQEFLNHYKHLDLPPSTKFRLEPDEIKGVSNFRLEEMGKDMMPTRHATLTYKDNEKVRKWMPRDHYFDFVEMMNPERYNDWQRAYGLIANDLLFTNGVRVLDLQEAFARNMYSFGPEKAFFEEERRLVMDFCRMVIAVF